MDHVTSKEARVVRFEGIWAIMPTPLTPAEELDEPALRRVARHAIDGGLNGLWMLGSGGEQPMFDLSLSRRVLEIAVEEAKGRIPVAAGISACSVREALLRMQMAREAGVDIVFSTEPFYYQLTAAEITDYFLALADATELPLVVYHNPARWPSGSMSARVLPQTLGRLAGHPKIIGMKDITRDPRDFQRLVFHLGPQGFTILTAAGRLLLMSLAVGGHGGAVPEAVVAPARYAELYRAFQSGDLARARELQRSLAPLGDALNAPSCTGGAAAKEALSLLGLCEAHVARPLHGMSAQDREALTKAMADLRLT